jgi:hypothetical protein
MIDGESSGYPSWIPFAACIGVIASVIQQCSESDDTVIEVCLVTRPAP